MKGMQGSIRRQPTSPLNFAGLRRHPRKDLDVEVLVQDQQGWEIPLDSVDFSAAGMFVSSNFLFDVGSVHNLIFRCPDGEELFSLRAQVVRVECEKSESNHSDVEFVPGMAYEFIDRREQTQQRIENLAARV